MTANCKHGRFPDLVIIVAKKNAPKRVLIWKNEILYVESGRDERAKRAAYVEFGPLA